MKVKHFYKIAVYLSLVLASTNTFAQYQQKIPPETLAQMVRSQAWRQLLHYDKNGISTINSDSFFLAADGKENPAAELSALIAAYSFPEESNPNQHPRCRFPARYYWLSQQQPNLFPLPENTFVPRQCTQFYRWSLLDEVDSLSLMLVSGYLANPASIFGHTFLKLNVSGRDTELFDLSISYGAVVPQDELIPLYIFRGLFGGYQAGFSDKYLYNEDQVYSHTEFRDIWEFKLHLSPTQKVLVIMQLWEIIGKKQDYYFLNRNCAWLQAQLLDSVIQEPVAQHGLLWYLPIETFFRLQSIDKQREKKEAPHLIESIHYHPSSQRVLLHYFAQLSPIEQQTVKELIQSDFTQLNEKERRMSAASFTKVLNACLVWCRYKKIVSPESKEIYDRLKNRILLKLLAYPAQQESLFTAIEEKASPTTKNPPQSIAFGFGYSDFQKFFTQIAWSPFSRHLLGSNSLEGDELVVFDATLGLWGEEDDLFLSRLDVLRIKKSRLQHPFFSEDGAWSWQLRLATEQDNDQQDVLFSFAIGQTWKLSPLYVYSLLKSSLHSLYPHIRLRPELGFFWQSSPIQGHFSIGIENNDANMSIDPIATLDLQWNISATQAIRVDIQKGQELFSGLQLVFYW